MADVVAVVVAAGSGVRLGRDRPKAFVELAGSPLFLHAARACAAGARVGWVVVVVGADQVEMATGLLAEAGLPRTIVCAGGATRQQSVLAGLEACPPEARIAAIHDAARPLLAPQLLDRAVDALTDDWDAVAPALPLIDAVKRVDGERVIETLDRETLRAIQAPQVFRHDWILAAHRDCAGADLPDDLAAAEQAGGRIRIIPGEVRNLKVTYPDDLRTATALLDGPVRDGSGMVVR